MVARLDFSQNRISGLSIPRDTLVAAGKYGEQKINAYHQFGGKDLAKEAVENLLPGVKVDRVVILDFEAFQDVVNTVGGVEIFVPKRMKWTDKAAKLYIDLKPGKQLLDGYNAMCFVRYRHGDSDFLRTDRQRDFLMAFKAAVFSDPLHLPEVANKGAAVLNNSLSISEIISLGKFTQKIGNDNIKMGLLPTVEAEGYNLRVDQSKLDATLQEFHLTDGTTRVSLIP
jgi:LCP family protein required for cell wall assembly